MKIKPSAMLSKSFSRRCFIQGATAAGALVYLPLKESQARSLQELRFASTRSAPVLSGTEINLEVSEALVNFNGQVKIATAINHSIPAPTLRLKEGDTVTIRVKNRLNVTTSIHWHGILLPFQMDGVPGISFPGIPPNSTFTYRFTLKQSGTYWYHSHSAMQEMTGMYGAIIIEPRHRHARRSDRDYVVMLSDWTDENPSRVFAKLKTQSDYYNFNQPTFGDFVNDASEQGLSSALNRREMWNKMRMSPTDLADLSASTLTFLMNGATSSENWTGLFKSGESVRLRFINGASNTFYDVRIPELPLTVIQSDGVDVEPVSVGEFRFGPGETYDVIVKPRAGAYTIFAQSMDRTGFARGTLAERPGLEASIPPLDRAKWLTMTDMMGVMEHSAMHHGETVTRIAHSNEDHSAIDHSMMDHSQETMAENPLHKASTKVRHARTEYGPSTDMRVDMPRTNLDDPGIGLRNNGRRVLTLADLSSIGGPLDNRMAERELELHLTGNMERYSWSFDGLEFGRSTPVHFRYGERVRVILHNDTMMTHPMHLHGMWSELETPEGQFQVRRHTVPVQPAQRVSFLVTADALGRWAWHCHLLFHMDAGMFRQVIVA
jgi:CopA family copper-resistance protein